MPYSVMDKVVNDIPVNRDAVVASLCRELPLREHEVARLIGCGLQINESHGKWA